MRWLHSIRVQLILSFFVFALTAIVLLKSPVDGLPELVRAGLTGAPFDRGILVPLASSLGAWLLCGCGLMLMGRLADSLSDNLQIVFVRSVLFVFLLFFIVERASNRALGWLQVHPLGQTRPWIQVFSSMAVAIAAAVILPRLRSIREGSALVRKQHARFLAAAESTLDDFYIFDGIRDPAGQIVDFRFSYINPNAERRLNVRREELVGKVLTEVRPFMKTSGLIEKYREVVRTGVPFTTEIFLDDERIKSTWLNVQVVKLGDGIAITSRDVTERRRLTDRIHYLAHHDHLTGLANRTLLRERLEQAIACARQQNEKVAVFLLDIDYFKQINDSLGHADGDALLAAFGKRLLVSVRETDTVARIGGDEFIIVMPGFKSAEDVRHAALTVIERASKPIAIGPREIRITVSAGVCLYPDCGLDPDQLLKNADNAMYTIKGAGRNGLHFFGAELPTPSGNPSQ
jgi:diguanylate cyclase (GGDEF)-like protein